jgi:prevent-host-death family protein
VPCRILFTPCVARIVPFTEARARLTELLDKVEKRHEHVVITRNGRPAAVVLSTDEYEALEETLELAGRGEAQARLAELRLTRREREDLKALPGTVREAVPWPTAGGGDSFA